MTESSLVGGRYRLRQELGAGAFGTVYRAEQRVLGITLRQVALKMFKGDKLRVPVEELLHDALEIVAIIEQCPDPLTRDLFVFCFDAGLTMGAEPSAFVTMELVAGDLDKRIGGDPLPVGLALDYALQIARGVAFMHDHGRLHRDLKPGNILLTADGRVKIGDFGLAVATGETLRTAPTAGTTVYQPPEAFAVGEITPSADVYAIGLICYEMLTGSLPYPKQVLAGGEDLDVGELIRAKLTPPEPPSRSVNVELRDHPELEEVVMVALDAGGSRYPDGAALVRALEAAAQQRIVPGHGRSTPWDEIDEGIAQARAALRRDDVSLAAELADKARVTNDSLPDANMVAALYALLVDVELRRGRSEEARKIAIEGLKRRRCADTYAAAAHAHEGTPIAATFAKQAGSASR